VSRLTFRQLSPCGSGVRTRWSGFPVAAPAARVVRVWCGFALLVSCRPATRGGHALGGLVHDEVGEVAGGVEVTVGHEAALAAVRTGAAWFSPRHSRNRFSRTGTSGPRPGIARPAGPFPGRLVHAHHRRSGAASYAATVVDPARAALFTVVAAVRWRSRVALPVRLLAAGPWTEVAAARGRNRPWARSSLGSEDLDAETADRYGWINVRSRMRSSPHSSTVLPCTSPVSSSVPLFERRL
jgi:hypothetical protein